MEQNPMLVEKHWHLLVYTVAAIGLPNTVSLYTSSADRLITIPEINQARKTGDVGEQAVLTGVSYLGFGSQSKFTGQPATPAPSQVSVMFTEGLKAGLAAESPEHALNPYIHDTTKAYQAEEWQLGFANGQTLRPV